MAGRTDGKLRVGAVNYLNTKPLIFGLSELAPRARLSLDVPSRLADQLAAGELDVALIPSIELFSNSDYRIVSDACIACRGPVMSVKLFCRVPAGLVRTLALDDGSRTSVALVRILLKKTHGIEPRLEPLPLGATLGDSSADAVLLIGDRAIRSPSGKYAEVWDLGDAWVNWAKLPFVFAMWVARKDTDLGELETALSAARDRGLANLEQIAEAEAAPLGMTRPECVTYLRDHLYFYLGERERRGLALFYRSAVELGILAQGVDFGFLGDELESAAADAR
jgi:chorismate dehydratase